MTEHNTSLASLLGEGVFLAPFLLMSSTGVVEEYSDPSI